MSYGMPYKGSKNAIAKLVIDMLPPADHFYDLFGGAVQFLIVPWNRGNISLSIIMN